MGFKDEDGLFPWTEGQMNDGVEIVKQKIMSGDEVERYMVDVTLTEIQLCEHLLTAGLVVQLQNGITRIPRILKVQGRKGYDAMLPFLTKAMEDFDEDDYILLGEAYTDIVSHQYLSAKDIEECILPTVLRVIQKATDSEVLDSYLSLLHEMIPLLDPSILEESVIKLALARGEVSETEVSRLVACRLMGAVSPRLPYGVVERTLFSKAMALCQDTDYLVRICMCEQLAPIAVAVGPEKAASTLLPEFQELLRDEESGVQMAAFEAGVALLEAKALPSDVVKRTVIPALGVGVTSVDEAERLKMVQMFGRLVVAAAHFLTTDDDWAVFLQAFKDFAGSGDVSQREQAAYNFPAVLQAVGPKRYERHLHQVYTRLAGDEASEVRVRVAAGFHVVAKLLGEERANVQLMETFVKLVSDVDAEVQARMLGNIVEILLAFGEGQDTVVAAAVEAVVKAEERLGVRWRHHAAVINALPTLADHASEEALLQTLVPLCFKYISSATAAPVGAAARAALPFVVRRIPRVGPRQDVMAAVVREYARARSCHARVAFVDLCEAFLGTFSRRFFREHLFEAAVETLSDTVVNVRLRACRLLPHLKRSVQLPLDAYMLERISKACTVLSTDSDRDVSVTARVAVSSFKVAPTWGGVLPAGNKALQEEEEEDKRREKEEQEAVQNEEASLKKKRADNALTRYFGGRRFSEAQSSSAPSSTRESRVSRVESKANRSSRLSQEGISAGLLEKASYRSRSLDVDGWSKTEALLKANSAIGGSERGKASTSAARPKPPLDKHK